MIAAPKRRVYTRGEFAKRMKYGQRPEGADNDGPEIVGL